MFPDFSSIRAKEKYFRSLEGERKYDALNEMIEESSHIVFLGGAGVSTESGIPDFIFESREDVPKCPECGKMVRPDVYCGTEP